MTLTDFIINNYGPLLVAILTILSYAQARLGPNDDWIESTRANIWPIVDKISGDLGRDWVSEASSKDYICTVDKTVEELEEVVHPEYSRNILATKKYRTLPDGSRQWTEGSWVYKSAHDAEKQHHIFFFPAADGGTDVYGHKEANTTDPSEHHRGNQTHGDPDRRFRKLLEKYD